MLPINQVILASGCLFFRCSVLFVISLVTAAQSKSNTLQISHMGYTCKGNGQRLFTSSNNFY